VALASNSDFVRFYPKIPHNIEHVQFYNVEDGERRFKNSSYNGGCAARGHRDKISEFEKAELRGCIFAFHREEDKGIGRRKPIAK